MSASVKGGMVSGLRVPTSACVCVCVYVCVCCAYLVAADDVAVEVVGVVLEGLAAVRAAVGGKINGSVEFGVLLSLIWARRARRRTRRTGGWR